MAYANPQKSKNLASRKIHQFISCKSLKFDIKKINRGFPVTYFAGSMGNHQTSMIEFLFQKNQETNARIVEEDGEPRRYSTEDRAQQPINEGGLSLLHFHLDGVESAECGCNEDVEDDDWCDNDACGNFSTIKENIKECLEPRSMYHVRLMRDVRKLAQSITGNYDRSNAAHMGAALHSIGYTVCLRSAIGGGDGTACFTHLRNEFLILDCDEERAHYMVEPYFREHFAIPHPTKRYKRLLDTIPKELVLPLSQVKPLVTLLCQEMSRSFAMKKMHLPPWRRECSLLSKWLPNKAHDIDIVLHVTSNGASPMPSSPPGLHTLSSDTAFMSATSHKDSNDCIEIEGKRLGAGRGEHNKKTSLLSKNLAAAQQYGLSGEAHRSLPHDTSYRSHTESFSQNHTRTHHVRPTASRSPIREHRPTKSKSGCVQEGMYPIRIVRPQGIFPQLPPAA